jgi:dethiobiotin synthetase
VRGYFVTATDTEVGKTAIACGLARLLAAHGHDVGVSKPVQSGALAHDPAGDAMLLRAAAGADEDAPHEVCPYSFAAPLAPLVASQLEGRSIEAEVILESVAELARRHDALIVEGAGGLLVPVGEDWTIADLAGWLGLPLVLVARAGLGTVNHTLLTLEAVRARGLEVAVVVLNGRSPGTDASADTNPELIERFGGVPVCSVPWLADGSALGLAEHVAGHLDRTTLLAMAQREEASSA